MGEHRCYSLRPFLLGRQTRVISFLGRTRTCSLLSPRQQRLLVAVLVRRDPKRKRTQKKTNLNHYPWFCRKRSSTPALFSREAGPHTVLRIFYITHTQIQRKGNVYICSPWKARDYVPMREEEIMVMQCVVWFQHYLLHSHFLLSFMQCAR
jgi:hypothetical protein